jgi:hypothetical protein
MAKQIFDDVIIKEYPEVYEEMTLIGIEREKKILAAKNIALQEYEEMMRIKGTLDSPYRKFKQYQEASKKSETSMGDSSSRINNDSRKMSKSGDVFRKRRGAEDLSQIIEDKELSVSHHTPNSRANSAYKYYKSFLFDKEEKKNEQEADSFRPEANSSSYQESESIEDSSDSEK